MSDTVADQPTGKQNKLFDFDTRLNVNTVLMLCGFLAGGFFFVSDTRSAITGLVVKVDELKKDTTSQINRLTDRVDRLADKRLVSP